MALVDQLLRLMVVRNAELLVLASGEVPLLRRGGANDPLSMPALDGAMVADLVPEVLDDEQRAQLAGGSGAIEASYEADDGTVFAAKVEARGPDAYRLIFRPAAAKPKPKPAPARPRPAARAASAPAPASTAAEVVPLRREPAFDPAAEPAAEVDPAMLDAIERALRRGASDLFLSSGHPARLRVDGHLVELSDVVCDDADILALIAPAMDEAAREQLARTGSADLALDLPDGNGGDERRFRVNVFRQERGLAAALRPVRSDIPSLAELGLPASFHRLTSYPHGLVLMTGAAGSGKSTTLVALVEQVNRTMPRHVITLEDPIEYRYRPNQALVHQREIGRDVDSFASGLRAAVRESPDIILLGEMRDLETISAALTAAETGHLVLGTLHAGTAASAIDRIIDVFPAHQQRQVRAQLAFALRAVVTQALLPARHGDGRVPAYELLLVNSAVANMIREDKVHQIPSVITTSKAEGMVPMARTLADLVRDGRVDLETAKSALGDPDQLLDMLGR